MTGTDSILFALADVWSLYLMAFVFTVVGLWTIWQPQGLLSWIKPLHKEVDVDDPEQQRFARFIGGGLIFFGVLLLLGLATSG